MKGWAIMKQDKTGKFIAECRKKQKLTQEQLAEKLGVTSKSISRWENGRTMPDVSLFEPLCKELNISVNELLKGEAIDDSGIQSALPSQPLIEPKLPAEYAEYLKRKTRNAAVIRTTIKTALCLPLLLCIIAVSTALFTNKTFFKDTYIGPQNQEIFVPKYSFFHNESGATVASFYSLKSEKQLEKEIDEYLSEFDYYSDEAWSGYKKGDLLISRYEVVNKGLYRVISITYD